LRWAMVPTPTLRPLVCSSSLPTAKSPSTRVCSQHPAQCQCTTFVSEAAQVQQACSAATRTR
jgi:hypothetical protein